MRGAITASSRRTVNCNLRPQPYENRLKWWIPKVLTLIPTWGKPVSVAVRLSAAIGPQNRNEASQFGKRSCQLPIRRKEDRLVESIRGCCADSDSSVRTFRRTKSNSTILIQVRHRPHRPATIGRRSAATSCRSDSCLEEAVVNDANGHCRSNAARRNAASRPGGQPT